MVELVGAQAGVAGPANVADMVVSVIRDAVVVDLRVELVHARSSERRDDTREGGAVTEFGVVARIMVAVSTTASGRVDVSLATVTEIVVVIRAVTVHLVAIELVAVDRVPVVVAATRTERAATVRVGVLDAGDDGLEVAGEIVVEGIAVLGILAEIRVALANVNKVRGLGGHQGIGRVIVNEVTSSVVVVVSSIGVVKRDVRVRLSNLPGVAGGRAATTTAGGRGDSTGADLVGLTINDPVVSKRVVHRVKLIKLGINKVVVVVLHRISNTVNTLGRASRPLRPIRKHAVDLKALKLVGALDARSREGGADLNLIERGLDEGDTKDLAEGRGQAKTASLGVKVSDDGESHAINADGVLANIRELIIETTVVGGLDGNAVPGLNGDVTENANATVQVPEITALIGVRARSPGRPAGVNNIERLNFRVGELDVISSLATVVVVTIEIVAIGSAASRLAEVVVASLVL